MASNQPSFRVRPWGSIGFGWLLAVIVFVYWLFVLLGLLPEAAKAVPFSLVALSLALLL